MLFLLACSQVWGTAFLQAGREFSSPLSTLHLYFLKGTLGVKQSTTNWAVPRECGHEPLQFYWFRSAVKLFNSMLNTNSDTLRRVVQADLNLHCPEATRSECARSARPNSRFSDCSQIALGWRTTALRAIARSAVSIAGIAILVIWSAVGVQFR